VDDAEDDAAAVAVIIAGGGGGGGGGGSGGDGLSAGDHLAGSVARFGLSLSVGCGSLADVGGSSCSGRDGC